MSSGPAINEIWMLPFFGQGYLLPCVELAKRLAFGNFKTTIIIPPNLSNVIPSSLLHIPLVQITEISSSGHPFQHTQMAEGLKQLLSTTTDSRRPICVIVHVMMSWAGDIFKSFGFVTVGFFTSGACSAAIEHAMWKADLTDIKPGDICPLPGLPEEMALTDSDIKRRPHGPLSGAGDPVPGFAGLSDGPGSPVAGFPWPPGMGPPPQPGGRSLWMENMEGAVAWMINTCKDLEGPFINYLRDQMGKPVWAVGPLIPGQFYRSTDSVIHDGQIRSYRQSNVIEDEVIEWLDSKPRGSVLYVSFGTEFGPTKEEYSRLADALEASKWPFIWVIQPGVGRSGPPHMQLMGSDGYFPDGLDSKVGERGLIIRGWAPQLLILSHPSTGGFLSNCGWNSTVEALGRGVPLLAWPNRDDQYFNAKLVVKYLRLGYMISDDQSKIIDKNDIIHGVERLLGDEEMKQRADIITNKFRHAFPATSMASLDAFTDFIAKKVL